MESLDSSEFPVVFVHEPSQHLKCPHCRHLYTDPVINVGCGHTFCRKCTFSCANCPLDGNPCDTAQLVVNRLVVGQIEDLEIYCKYGLCKQNGSFVPDQSGCQEKIHLGRRFDHENHCTFIPLSCPNSSNCGRFRKSEMQEHLKTCVYTPCQHRDKGCEFVGRQDQVEEHTKVCGYRGFSKSVSMDQFQEQSKELKETNKDLQEEIKVLTQKVEQLQTANTALESQVENCVSSLHSMQQKYEHLQGLVDQLLTARNRRSLGSPSNSAEAKQRSSSFRKSQSGSPPSTTRLDKWEMPFTFKCIGTLRGHQDVVWCLVTHKGRLFTSGADKVIKVWNMENLVKGCVKSIQGHSGVVHTMAICGDILYTAGDDRSIRAWNTDTLAEIQVLENAHDQLISDMIAVRDYLFTSSFSLIKVWEAKTLTFKHTISGLYHWVRALALNPERDKLYSGSHNTIDIWDVSGNFALKGKVDHTFGSVYSLTVTSKYLIAGTYNRNIQVFDATTYEHIFSLRGHIGIVNDVVASPSGRYLFSGSSDASVKIWNLENMLPIQTLQRHEGSVNALILYGDFLLSGAEDHEIKVFKYFQMQMGFAFNT